LFYKKVKKTQQQISPSINVLLFKLILLLFTKIIVQFDLNKNFECRHNRILSIRRISDFGKSVGFRRIRNPSHP